MAKATIGQDLTQHDDEAMALPKKLTTGREKGHGRNHVCYLLYWELVIRCGWEKLRYEM